MKSSRVVIKIGGSTLQSAETLEHVVEAIAQYRQFGYQVVLIHGGGLAINREFKRRGIEWQFHDGQRVTTPKMTEVIEMVLCGQVNRQIVSQLEQAKIPALGVSCAQETVFVCKRFSPDLQRVGSVTAVNTRKLERILAWPMAPVPVLAPMGVDRRGQVYNINADWAASFLASQLGAQYLICLTDQDGIWNEAQVCLDFANPELLQQLICDNTVTDGMLTKVRSVLHALKSGVRAVRIMKADHAVQGLWHDEIGTWCANAFPAELQWSADESEEVFYAKV